MDIKIECTWMARAYTVEIDDLKELVCIENPADYGERN
jgi:hypothetical protein